MRDLIILYKCLKDLSKNNIQILVTHPINQAEFIEVDPAGHEGVAEGHQLGLVAHHELLGGHLHEGLAVGQANQVVQPEAGHETLLGDHVGDRLKQTSTLINYTVWKILTF